MRPFPRTRCRRLAVAALATVVVGGVTLPLIEPAAVPWAAAADGDKLKKKQKAVKKEIASADHALEESSNELAVATKALSAANATLATAQAKLTAAKAKLVTVEASLAQAKAADLAMQAALVQARAKLAQARQELATGSAAATAQREKAESTLIKMAQGGDPRVLALAALLNATGPEDLARQQEFNTAVISGQSAAYGELKATEVMLSVREGQVKGATDEVAAQRKKAAANLARMRDLEQQAVSARDAVASWVTQAASAQSAATSAAQVASRQRAKDQQALKALKSEEQRIRLQILAAAKNETNRNVDSLAGLFLHPVRNSYITSPYGWRKHPIYGYWGLHDGDDLHAPCGTPEIAIGDGRITDRYFSSVWGNRLFLNLGKINGHNYTAIYNHISTYKVSVGEVVAAGSTVALAGTTGWSTGCHLHFTILKDGDAVNPSSLM